MKEILKKILQFAISGILIILIFKVVGMPDLRWLNRTYDVKNIYVITRNGADGYKEIRANKIEKYNVQDYLLKEDELEDVAEKLHKEEQYLSPDQFYPRFKIKISNNTTPQQITFTCTDDRRGYQNRYIVQNSGIKPVYQAESNALDLLGMGLTFGVLIIYLFGFIVIHKLTGETIIKNKNIK